LVRTPKKMASLVHMCANAYVRHLPATPSIVAIVRKIIRICPRTIRERWNNFLDMCRVRLQAMRTEYGKFDSLIAAT
jgi:hypothetical protein